MILIGINGFKRSGKNTVYDIINELSPREFVQGVGFADKLKVMAALALGYRGTERELIRMMDSFKEEGRVDSGMTGAAWPMFGEVITGRQYLQNFGVEARKLFGDTFWIDQVLPQPVWHFDSLDRERWLSHRDGLREVAKRYSSAYIVCLTDLRFPNEAERVKNLGGEVWEVIRPGTESDGHESEIRLPRELVDRVINNSGTIAELRTEVSAAVAGLKHGS